MKTRAATMVVLSSLLWAPPGLAQQGAFDSSEEKGFTTDADFALGTFSGTSAGAPNPDQLRLSSGTSLSPIIWLPTTAGYVLKLDTVTGKQVARYYSVLTTNWDGSTPTVGSPTGGCNYPTVAAVDADGNAYVVNRGNCTNTFASVTKYAGSLAACVDRNGNGTIDTSSDIDGNGSIGTSVGTEFRGLADECVLWTKNYAAAGDQGRSLAVDADQNLWLAGYSSSKLYKMDGQTGAVLKVIDLQAETGNATNIQGLAFGPGGFLYASDGSPLRIVQKINPHAAGGSHVVDSLVAPVPTSGIAVDAQGVVWLGADSDSATGPVRVDFGARTAAMVGHCAGRSKGVAIDGLGRAWVGCTNAGRMQALHPDGTIAGQWVLNQRPEGVAVDTSGKIWFNHITNSLVWRLDPTLSSSATQSFNGGGISIATGDLTGTQFLRSILRKGTWKVVHDSGQPLQHWGRVAWNREAQGVTPPGSSITVEARAAETLAELANKVFISMPNNQLVAGVDGRFIELRVTLRAMYLSGEPVLSDLGLYSYNNPPVAQCRNQDVCAAPTSCTAQVSVDNGSYDPDGDPLVLTQSPAGPYGIGSRSVALTVSDPSESASCAGSVSVRDCAPPSITCGGPLQAECSSNESATVTAIAAEATDSCSAVSVNGPGQTVFPLGSTPVTYTAADAAGNTASCSTTIQVVDTLVPSISCPAPVTAECVDGGASSSGVPAATATDACSPVAVASPAPARYPLGSAVLTYSATDSSGNTASCTTSFTVADTKAPVLALSGEAPQAVECGTSYVDPGASAADACAGNLNAKVVASGEVNPQQPGSYTRSYSVTDPSGNSAASVSRTVNVADSLAPSVTLNGPVQQSLECGSSYVDPGATASDLCAGALTVVASGEIEPMKPGSYIRSYGATDPSGHSAAVSRTVNVADTLNPSLVFNGPAQMSLECGSSYMEPGAQASDACAGDLTSAVVITGSVDSTKPGDYVRSYSVTDPSGNTTGPADRSVTVMDTLAPVIALNGAAQVTHECADPFVDPSAIASDACMGDVSNRVVTTGSVNPAQLGTYSLSYGVTDLSGNSAGPVTRTVTVTDTRAPSLALNGPAVQDVECGTSFTNPGATALDACAGNLSSSIVSEGSVNTLAPGSYTLTYEVADPSGNTAAAVARTVNVADTQAPALTLNGPAQQSLECGSSYVDPGAAADDLCTGDLTASVVVSGTVDPMKPGSYTRSYSVTDPSGHSAGPVTRAVTVADTLAPSLLLLGSSSESLECGAAYVDPGVQASDACVGDLSAQVVATGTVDSAKPGSYTRSYSVTDPSGNSAGPVTRTVTVADTQAPVIALNGGSSVSVACGEPYNDQGATASDACAGDLSNQVVTTGSVNEALPGTYTLGYSVADSVGNQATASRTVQVTDSEPPVLSLKGPSALAQECAAPFTDPGATAMDSCLGDMSDRVTVSGSVNTQQPGSYVLTYGATDTVGHAATPVTRTVTVADTQGPSLALNGPNPMPLECMRDWYNEPGATATDACAGDLSGSIAIEHGFIDSATPGHYAVTYRATDGAGNSATALRDVHVEDTLAPELYLNGSPNPVLECKVSTFVDEGATANDLCSGNLSEAITVTGTVNTDAPGAYPLNYRVQDSRGLVTEKTRQVTVVDTRRPTITLLGGTSPVVECTRGSFNDPGATAADLCAGDISHRIVVSGASSITAPGTYPITYNVTDPSGNAAESVTRNVTVQDTQAPVITINGASTMELQCNVDTYTEQGATANDACQGPMPVHIWGAGANTKSVGTYSIQYGIWDSAGNTASVLRTVKVVDTIPPTLELKGPSTLHHECASGPFVEPGATASDICYGDLSSHVSITGSVNAWQPASYTLTYNVQDSGNLKAPTLTRTVNVADTQPPTLEYRTVTMTPADHTMRSFTLADCATANDKCDGWANINSGTIVSVYSDEPEEAAGDSDGATLKDIVITGKSSFSLRSERKNTGNGRVYGVNFELKDKAGNTRSGQCKIQVPGTDGTAVDDGPGSGYVIVVPPSQSLASRTVQ